MRFVAWPEEKRRIDIGSFYSDSSKFGRATGWAPAVPLGDGLSRTLAYYRAHYDRYVEAADPVQGSPSR
jgi:nucleoside-diphosphate-sugar epimerase